MPAIPIWCRRRAGRSRREFARDLGKWGKTRLNLHYYRIEDIVDVIPIGVDGQGVGNLPRATARRIRKRQHVAGSIRSAGRAPSST